MIDELKKNINLEIRITTEIAEFMRRAKSSSENEKTLLLQVIDSLKSRLKIINQTIPEIISDINPTKKLNPKIEKKNVVYVQESNNQIILKKEDKDKYFQELSIAEDLIRRLKKSETKLKKKKFSEQKANLYAKWSNKFFLEKANSLIDKGYFRSLGFDLQRSNMGILTSSYISMMIMSSILSVGIAFVIMIFLLFFNLGITVPFLTVYDGSYLSRLIKVIWVIPLIPLLVFAGFYLYPASEKKSIAKRIDQELPFMVIHMGSISGSGIEPTQIFKIIATSQEYKHAGGEIRKLINQVNVYGYDLVTALKNVAKTTPSIHLAELLNGLGSNIKSGGSLGSFFEKRAETLLLNYKLEREKFSKIAETFMDIYISVVIATPMILLLLLILVSVSGLNIGLGISTLTLLIITVVGAINVLFLVFLAIKQPGY